MAFGAHKVDQNIEGLCISCRARAEQKEYLARIEAEIFDMKVSIFHYYLKRKNSNYLFPGSVEGSQGAGSCG